MSFKTKQDTEQRGRGVPSLVDAGTQTVGLKEVDELQKAAAIREKIRAALTEDDLIKLVKEEWPKGAYIRTKFTITTILPDRECRVVIHNKGSDKDRQVLQRLETQIPAIKGLQGKNSLQKGKTAVMVRQGNLTIGEGECDEATPRMLILTKLDTITSVTGLMRTIKGLVNEAAKT